MPTSPMTFSSGTRQSSKTSSHGPSPPLITACFLPTENPRVPTGHAEGGTRPGAAPPLGDRARPGEAHTPPAELGGDVHRVEAQIRAATPDLEQFIAELGGIVRLDQQRPELFLHRLHLAPDEVAEGVRQRLLLVAERKIHLRRKLN